MIQTFKRKIIWLLFGIFATVLIGILGTVNVFYVHSNYRQVERILSVQMKIVDEEEEKRPGIFAQEGPNIQLSEIYTVRCTIDGEMTVENKRSSQTMGESEIKAVAEDVLEMIEEDGRMDHFQYMVVHDGDDLLVSYMDVSGYKSQERWMQLISIGIGVVGMLVLTGVSAALSKWLVRPMEQAFAKQREFISSAGHELKTPLTVMKASLSMLKEELGENKYLDYVMEENEQMTSLVHELLTLSHLEYEEEPKKERLCLSKVLEGAVLPFEVLAFEKNIQFQIEVAPEIWGFGEEKELQQLAGIFMDNALKHTSAGEEVRVIFQKNGVFQVSNQGEPIPEEEKQKIFEQFYRVDKARNREEGRYGLGLAIAKRIALHHRTKIQVECKNHWTTFSIKLKVDGNKKSE